MDHVCVYVVQAQVGQVWSDFICQTHVKIDTLGTYMWEQHRVVFEPEKMEFHNSTILQPMKDGCWYVGKSFPWTSKQLGRGN